MEDLKRMRLPDDGGWLEAALLSDKENVAILNNLKIRLKKEYLNYNRQIDSHLYPLCQSLFLEAKEKEALHDFYISPATSYASKVKARRHEHGLYACPYCGHPFKPDTIDHFIPKEKWPEYSIFPNNLVPQCKYCMPIKGQNYHCKYTLSAMYLHPFYNDILSKINFNVNVEFSSESANFIVGFSAPELDAQQKERAIRHLQELQVKRRFREYCEETYQRWKHKRRLNKFDVRDSFMARYRENGSGAKILHNWKAAFYKGILQNQELIDYLDSLPVAVTA